MAEFEVERVGGELKRFGVEGSDVPFKVVSPYEPAGSQPKAIESLVQGVRDGDRYQVLLGVTGSGKTFTLVERIVYLITHKGVAPESLLVVTFTDKAARELTTRISNRLAELNIQFNLNEMYLGTFHSICLRLLEDYREFTRLKRSFTLFDQFDQQYFLYQHIKDHIVQGIGAGRWKPGDRLQPALALPTCRRCSA